MSSLSEELLEAAKADTQPELYPGQYVIVRTKSGERVTAGTIVYIHQDMGVARVATGTGGSSDTQIDVDVTKYDLWVVDPERVPVQRLPAASGPHRDPLS